MVHPVSHRPAGGQHSCNTMRPVTGAISRRNNGLKLAPARGLGRKHQCCQYCPHASCSAIDLVRCLVWRLHVGLGTRPGTDYSERGARLCSWLSRRRRINCTLEVLMIRISDIAGPGRWRHAPPDPVVGFDIGSRGSKGVLLTPDAIYPMFVPTGLYMQ